MKHGKVVITVIILTKDEESSIRRCLKSVSFCDEIVLIDDYSKDKTRQVARDFGAIIYKRKLFNDYAKQRNFGLSKAKNDWVLFLDADEVVTEKLRDELTNIDFNKLFYSGYYIKRRDILWGKKVKWGESGNIKLLRLARRDSGRFKRAVHEIWNVYGKVGVLEGELYHYSHESITDFIDKVKDYSKLHAKENEKEGKRSALFKIILFPLFKFLDNYFLRLAMLDGVRGFVVSIVMSMHSFVSWSTLWLNQRK